MSRGARILGRLVEMYQVSTRHRVSPCRYVPSCSQYAREALEEHGAWRGTWLAVRRVGRCHPWGGFGFDPVPQRRRAPAAAAPAGHEHGHERGHGPGREGGL